MPAFKKLGPGDQIDNVLVLEPQWTLASGSGGWRGSPEGSASINLYGGAHRRPGGVFREYQYESIIPGQNTFGQLKRTNPITASVDLVRMTSADLNLSQRSRTRWGYEHWKTVMRLYHDYSRRDPDYTTGSYDYYCLYFQKDSNQIVQFPPPLEAGLEMTSSFTVESWVKPLLTASADQDFTIASMNRVFWFGITGSTGQLVLSSSFASITSSVGPSPGEWSHVAVRWDATTNTGTFTINCTDAGEFRTTTSLSAALGSYKPALTIGNVFDPSAGSETIGSMTGSGMTKRSFHGLIGETRLWYLHRSITELSTSMRVSLTGSALAHSGSVLCARFSDGPLALFPTHTNANAPTQMGSGTVNSTAMEHLRRENSPTRYPWGWLLQFDDRVGPVWHPNDNIDFRPVKRLAAAPECPPVAMQTLGANTSGSGYASVSDMVVIHVPSAFYGRQISPNSVSLSCRAFSADSYGLRRTLVDDGRGGLYLSGSASVSSSDYEGVGWNKVGNVFYSEGLIVIKDPALQDFGLLAAGKSETPTDVLQLDFRGHSRIPVKTVIARIDRGELNRSLNPTYYRTEDDGFRSIRHPSGNLYVTTVGLYNSDRELVGVARLAEPLRVRPRDRFAIKVRMDF